MKKPILGCVLLCLASPGHGQLAQNLTVGSAKALSLANAVTADTPGIDSIHYNPAGLYQVKGRQYQLKVIAGQFTIQGEVEHSDRYRRLMDQFGYDDAADPVTEGESATSDVSVMLPFVGLTEIPLLVAPLGGASVELNDGQFVMGTSVFAPMVVGYKRSENGPLRYQGNELGLTHLTYFSPTVAFPINDQLTFGVGLHFNYTGVGIDLDFRLPNAILVGVDSFSGLLCQFPEIAEVVNLCEGDLGPFTDIGNIEVEVESYLNPSFNLGLLWEPNAWLAVGMVYQSGASKTLQGDYRITYGEDWLGFFGGLNSTWVGDTATGVLALPKGVAVEEGEASLEFTVPQHFALGLSVDVTPDWTLNADIKWTDTAQWDEFKLEFDNPPEFLPVLSYLAPEQVSNASLAFPRGYESVWSWALGVEHRYNDRLALRFGYEDRGNSIPADKADYLAPFGDAYLVGAGFAYVPRADSLLEVGIGMLVSENSAANNTSSNANDYNQLIYNPYAGVNLKTDVRAYLIELSYQAHF
ncbi:MAG: outer membrane protein transport protein [Pseudomonadota bacterium]|nr:outer membrane protein transport protein [Pseudomonadota bacterium]